MALSSQTEVFPSSGDGYKPHVLRTATDPRQEGLYRVYLSDIKPVGDKIRLIQLRLPTEAPPIRHLPGQWLDVHIPGIDQIGGFTITSPSSTAILAPLNTHPYLELAVQESPSNPPAAYLWRPISEIKGTEFQVRVGGNFVWPPPKLSSSEISDLKRAVFVAGGVGINPLMSMLSTLFESTKWPPVVRLFYSVRFSPEDAKSARTLSSILFFTRLNSIVRDARTWGIDFKFRLVITGSLPDDKPLSDDMEESVTPSLAEISYGKRIQWTEIQEAIGTEEDRKNAVAYICGPQSMTDEFAEGLKDKEGMKDERVLYEKWW